MAGVDIPYESFVLDNGLTVVVHEDRKAPIVAIAAWYNVGSKDEPQGRTGFAHLFEHIMLFNGTEHVPNLIEPMREMGATNWNGTTWFDRTNYFETVPTQALDRALYIESERMGYIVGALTQERLDAQRGIVQNEKRQGDNQPYGMGEYRQLEALFPEGHPYRHSTIGSMADLDAATLEDAPHLVPRELWPQQRRARACGRHQRRGGAHLRAALFWRHPARRRERACRCRCANARRPD